MARAQLNVNIEEVEVVANRKHEMTLQKQKTLISASRNSSLFAFVVYSFHLLI